MLSLSPFLVLVFISSEVAFVDAQFQAVKHVLKHLYDQADVQPNSPINIFIDSKSRELQYLSMIQNDLGLSVMSAQTNRNYSLKMKDYRTQWKGWTNVLELRRTEDLRDYFSMIKTRWYTFDENRIGMKRMMDFVYNNIIHIIVLPQEDWNEDKMKDLRSFLTEEMLVLLILYTQDNFGVYFNRANSDGSNRMRIINFWSKENGFSRKERLFPSQMGIYQNLQGRVFKHPVVHKPPWNYVSYGPNKEFIEDNGGRDITLLDILSKKLNFRHESFDPLATGIRRTRGSKFRANQSFPGIIGALHSRLEQFYFYLGDTTQTYNRNKAVDFSFYVLADAGAFATTAGRSYVPPDLLIKPFEPNIWLIVLISMIVGSVVLVLTYSYSVMNLLERVIRMGLLMIKIALSQSDRHCTEVKQRVNHPFRIVMGTYLITLNCILSATYSGMLVSYFSLPSYEKTLNTLEELNDAMDFLGSNSKMALGVVKGSSSYGIISTGGGVYGEIWEKMQTHELYELNSVNQGLEEVLVNPKFAVFAGRQKLLFDTLRLGGKSRFHVNQSPFFVKYKCVAFRMGSPFKEAFDRNILRLHAGGIINKITSDEFIGLTPRIGVRGPLWKEKYKVQKGESLEEGLPKIALKHISAIFYLLLICHFLAFIIFFAYEKRCSFSIIATN